MEATMKYIVRFFFLLLTLLPLSCNDKIEPGNTARAPLVVKGLSLETAQIKDKPLIYEAVGTVKAGISSKLAAKVLGNVEEIRVREGDLVKKGDVLIVIDPRQAKAGVQMAQAGLSEARKALAAAASARAAAQAGERLAYTTYERFKTLKSRKLVSSQTFEEKQAQYSQAKAALEKAKAVEEAARARINQAGAALTAVRVTRKDTVITAPHDGIITGKMVDKGDLASPGVPLLSLETTKGFCVDMVLPETYIDYVQPGQNVSVEVPALKTGLLEGTVCTIVPSADPRSRSFIVKVNLPIDRKVRSGLFARVRIPTGQSKKLLIGKRAVITRGQLTGLYLVDSENIAHFRLIRLGKEFGTSAEVLSGLREGDRYIKNPSMNLSDGTRVEVSP